MTVQQVKPVAELALACDLMRHTKSVSRFSSEAGALSNSILEHCWKELERGEVLRRLLTRSLDLYSLITVYPPFRRAGLRNKALECVIATLSSSSGILALEFPAWRLLDFAVALQMLGMHSPWEPKRIFAHTWLGKRPWPWLLSDNAAYSLTHTVFYATDFGRTPTGLSEHTRTYLTRWCAVWCDYYVQVKNFDLLCELIMVTHCIGKCAPSRAVRHLSNAQKSNGAVPVPAVLATMLARTGVGRSNSRFLQTYHTTLVALMAHTMRG